MITLYRLAIIDKDFVFLKEDKWRPMNHMSEKDCHKFVEEVSAVGLDLKPYVYGEY